MGLLDFKMPGMDTPEGQGLLAAAFNLMQAQKYPGQKGALGFALGDAGRTYLQTSNQSRDQAQRRKYLDAQMEAQQMQLEAARRAEQQRTAQEAAIRNHFAPMGPAQAMSNGQGPTMQNAQRLGQMPQFDPRRLLQEGGVGALEQGLKINDALNPKPQGPIKLGENDRLLDPATYRELVSPVQKPQVIDYNKPFLPDGTPNKAYQDYSLTKARTGATNVNVGGSKNIFNQENEQSKAYGKGMGELRIEIQKAGFSAPSQLTKLARMEELLSGVDGGKLAPAGMEAASLAKSLGFNVDPKLGNKEGAAALAVEMALAMKQPGSGPTTDRDFDNFMATVPGLSKTPEGRKQITQTMRAKAKRDIEIAKMARAYAAKNDGVLDDGFLDQVAEFVAQNPVVTSAPSSNVDALVDKYRSK